jgi:vacuolar protein-sorting-associated protein 4
MQPIRKILAATHYKPIEVSDTSDELVKWTPCSPGDPTAVEKNWMEINPHELHEPVLKFSDLLKSLDTVRPTVVSADIQRHNAWTKDFG